MNRDIVCPAIYKHFKGMDYATMFCSQPISVEELTGHAEKLKVGIFSLHYITAIYTEDLESEIYIFKIDDKLCHLSSQEEGELIIYRPLYPFAFSTVARPKKMFLSKVDKEKYPNVEQEYRFELVRY